MILDVEKLDIFLAKKCMSRTDLKRLANISSATVAKAAHGGDLKPRTFGRICAALDIPPQAILVFRSDKGGGQK